MLLLSPDHLVDIRRSGLSDDTITLAGIQTVPPRDIKKALGFDFPDLASMYKIPYPGCDGFSRFRCFPAEGKQVARYYQRKESGNHLYIPAAVASMLSDPTTTTYITEGEKKALKASQEGLACIAVGGLWNWKDKDGGLISGFDKITLAGRDIGIIPDNDYLKPNVHGYKKNLEQAVQELAYVLIDKGAKVFVVVLPDGPAKGIDDYLIIHSVAEFHALPSKQIRKLTLEEAVAEVTLDSLDSVLKRIAGLPSAAKQEALVAELSKILKVSKTALKKDLKRHGAKLEGDQADVWVYVSAKPLRSFRGLWILSTMTARRYFSQRMLLAYESRPLWTSMAFNMFRRQRNIFPSCWHGPTNAVTITRLMTGNCSMTSWPICGVSHLYLLTNGR